MSLWDSGRPPAGQHDSMPPAGAGGNGPEGWPADDQWQAEGGRPLAEGSWPPAGDGWPPDDAWPAENGWDDEPGTAPYPVTYERDDFWVPPGQEAAAPEPDEPWQAPSRQPAAPRSYEPWPPAPYPRQFPDPGEQAGDAGGPSAPGRDRWAPARAAFGAAAERPTASWAGHGDQDLDEPDQDELYRRGGGAGRGRRGRPGRGDRKPRWLLPAGIIVLAAVTGTTAILLTSGHPGGRVSAGGGFVAPSTTPSATASPSARASATGPASNAPLTMGQAQGVLAGYTTVNNGANAQRSDTLLAVTETGSSYAIDAGIYQRQRGSGAAPYPAFGPVQATYYIPGNEPPGGPRWFVVRVANAFSAHPHTVTSTEYLLFTQATPGGAWQDAIEPYLLSGTGTPQVAVGPDGLATAVAPGATATAFAPGQLAALTAASLDGTGHAVANPGNLADLGDARFWRGKLPSATVTDTHAPAAGAGGQEFALRTVDGGALVFYTDAAELTITPQAGTSLHLTVPGFYSPAQALSQARVSYLEQLAAYDPPAGSGAAARIVADYSGITGKN